MYDEELQSECTTVGQYLFRTIIYCVLIAIIDYKLFYLYPETILTQLKWFAIASLICLPFRNIIEYTVNDEGQRTGILGPWYVKVIFVVAIFGQYEFGGNANENNPENHELCTITKAYIEEYVANNPEIAISKNDSYLVTNIEDIEYEGWLKPKKEDDAEIWVIFSYDAEINQEYGQDILCRVSASGDIKMEEYFEVYEKEKEEYEKKLFKKKNSEYRYSYVEEDEYIKYINSIDKKVKYKKKYYIERELLQEHSE